MGACNWIFRCAVTALVIFSNCTLALCCDPNMTEPDFFIHGLCFSPYLDGQSPSSTQRVSRDQVQERLAVITRRPHTEWIRTYGAANGLEQIPYDANSLGLKTAMGIWIRNDPNLEIANLLAACQAGVVDIAVIGNEEIYAYRNHHENAISPDALVSLIRRVRKALDDAGFSYIPVTEPEPHHILFGRDAFGVCTVLEPNLIEAVDAVFVNIFPFHEETHIDIALQELAETYRCIADAIHADPNYAAKEIIIGETGWPSDGLSKGDAEPSLDNQARYFSEVSQWSLENDVNMFYLGAFNEKYKEIPEADSLYTLIEGHWGIWDSQGRLKRGFVSEPILCETFEGSDLNSFVGEIHYNSLAPEPNVLSGDIGSDGHFLRLLYDGDANTLYSYIAFDRTAAGAYPRIEAEFDFRMDGPDENQDADGFSFLLLPTFLHGVSGPTQYGNHDNVYGDEPAMPRVFGVGFDIWEWQLDPPINQPCDHVYISWDQSWYPNKEFIDVSPMLDLDSGLFQRVKIVLQASGDDSLLTLTVIPNVYQSPPGDPVVIADGLRIPGLKPYENRVVFLGRNGWQDVNADLDNIKVVYKKYACGSPLPGDLNGDGKVNLEDFSIFVSQWLCDCNSG